MLGMPGLFDDVAELEARGDLTLRCVVPVLLEPDTTRRGDRASCCASATARGRRWRAGAAKFFIDGVIDTGTAWLFEPGPHGEGTEPFWPDPGRYAEVVARFARARLPVRDARDRRPRGRGRARRLPRRRRARDARRTGSSTSRRCATPSSRRLAAEGVAASMQPLHAAGLDEPGPYQLARQPAAASRSPPASAGPTSGAAARSSRSARTGRSSAPTRASASPGRGCGRAPGRPERTPFTPGAGARRATEALEGYTTEAARVVGEEHLTGRIAPGHARRPDRAGGRPASTARADELPDVPVLLTVVDGAVVHPGLSRCRAADIAVVGAGIVGLAVARELGAARSAAGASSCSSARPRRGAHQTGHNSGVAHAGHLLRAGLAQGAPVRRGRARAGGVLRGARPRLRALRQADRRARRAASCRRSTSSSGAARRTACRGCGGSTPAELREIEPHAAGIAALHSPATAIVRLRARVARALADDLRAAGRRDRLRRARCDGLRAGARRRLVLRHAARRGDRRRASRSFCAGRVVGPARAAGRRGPGPADRPVPRRLPAARAASPRRSCAG